MKRFDHFGIVSFQDVPSAIQQNYVVNYQALGMEYCEEGDLRSVSDMYKLKSVCIYGLVNLKYGKISVGWLSISCLNELYFEFFAIFLLKCKEAYCDHWSINKIYIEQNPGVLGRILPGHLVWPKCEQVLCHALYAHFVDFFNTRKKFSYTIFLIFAVFELWDI